MDDTGNGGSASGQESSRASQSSSRTNKYHRHTYEQIQRLEGFFNECDRPNKKARLELSRELGLSPLQIKFWFQNRRTQLKVKQGKEDIVTLRTENDRIKSEINAMREALKTLVCTSCGNSCQVGEDAACMDDEQKLCLENAHLREEIQRVSREVEKYRGMPDSQLNPQYLSPLPNFGQQGIRITDGPSHGLLPGNSSTIQTLPFGITITDLQKSFMVDLARNAMEELNCLLQSNALWISSSSNGRTVLNLEAYGSVFPRAVNSPNVRTESSKDSSMVSMNSLALVDFFMDANKWMELFPTIVSKARTIEVISAGVMGSQNGLLQLMYEELQVLSPLVQTRKFYFLRFCQQIKQNLWAIVDVTYDVPQELSDYHCRVRRLPSGCYIEDMLNGGSKITWMEHMQIEDRRPIHELYREHIYSGLAFGAERRLAALQRMCERFNYQMDSSTWYFHLEGVNPSSHGKRYLMKLSQRMVSSFCSSIHPVNGQQVIITEMNDFEMNGFDVHATLRKCTNPGHPDSGVFSATTTTRLPFSHQKIFDFLTHQNSRPQWDIIFDYNSVQEVGRIACGYHSGNSISILRAFSTSQNNKLILQEIWIDSSGALVVYCPVPLPAINMAMNGEDPSIFPLSPSGFVISPSGKTSGALSGGALVTIVLQSIENSATSGNISQESANILNSFVAATINHIKAALN